MHHILAQYRFDGIFGFEYAQFKKKVHLGRFFFYILVLFSPKHPILEMFLLIKTPKTCKSRCWPKKMENLVKKNISDMSLEKFK